MKIILLKDIAKLGKKYDVKTVNEGHAINLLIPRGLAVVATPDALKRLESEQSQMNVIRKIQEDLLVKNIDGIKNITLIITGKANQKGHLFAGIHREEIVREIEKQHHLQIIPNFIELEHPIKVIGHHKVEIKAAGQSATLKIEVKAI